MAKVGEGDDRWIVKDRADGKNCNNWHWSETNLTAWAKEQLTEALCKLVAFEDNTGFCKVTELETMTGDVTVQMRKQKKFPLYELELTLKWEGELYDAEGKTKCEAKGKIKIPDLSEETWDDLEMTVVLDDETAAKRPLKEAMRTKGVPKVREACAAFCTTLRTQVSAGTEMKAKAPPAERFNSSYVSTASETGKTAEIKLKYDFNPPPQVIYDSLLDTNRIRGVTASDASMSSEVGASFSMFSGAVTGENVELVPFNGERALIKWKWRFATWQPTMHSSVVITLTEKDGTTKLELVQTGVPESERERTEKGWTGLLFDRMKAMFGGSVPS